MTAALEAGEWSAARPGRTLPQGKTRYPFYRRQCGPQGGSGQAENLVLTGVYAEVCVRYIFKYIYIYMHIFSLQTLFSQRGMAFGFQKTATAVIKPDG